MQINAAQNEAVAKFSYLSSDKAVLCKNLQDKMSCSYPSLNTAQELLGPLLWAAVSASCCQNKVRFYLLHQMTQCSL